MAKKRVYWVRVNLEYEFIQYGLTDLLLPCDKHIIHLLPLPTIPVAESEIKIRHGRVTYQCCGSTPYAG